MCQMALDSVIHSLYCILHIFDILFKIDILQRVMELNKKKREAYIDKYIKSCININICEKSGIKHILVLTYYVRVR